LPFGPIVLRDGKRRDELRRLVARMRRKKISNFGAYQHRRPNWGEIRRKAIDGTALLAG
jgi:hypothetical protein